MQLLEMEPMQFVKKEMGKMKGKKKVSECEPGKEFVFRMPDGREVGKAKDLSEFFSVVKNAPLSSILYHANGEHFSPWLKMLGQQNLAEKIKSFKGISEQVRENILKLSK